MNLALVSHSYQDRIELVACNEYEYEDIIIFAIKLAQLVRYLIMVQDVASLIPNVDVFFAHIKKLF